MRSTLRGTVAVILVAVGPAGAARAPDASRGHARGPTPIRDSIDRAVEAVVRKYLRPCDEAEQRGVPCFPVTIEEEGPRFSVTEALRRYRGEGPPAPGPPTVAEIQSQMSGAQQSASGGVGFDPFCTAKNLLKKISGKGTIFHLYRTWDARGERPMLTDRPLDPSVYAANADFHYEYLGTFDGECAAVAAWRAALRGATAPSPPPNEERRPPADTVPPPP